MKWTRWLKWFGLTAWLASGVYIVCWEVSLKSLSWRETARKNALEKEFGVGNLQDPALHEQTARKLLKKSRHEVDSGTLRYLTQQLSAKPLQVS